MKALICGGSGFVGQHVLKRLDAGGHTARIYDRVMPATGSGVLGDIHDMELLAEAMQDADTIFHLASNSDISASAKDPTIDFREGTELTQNVLEAMRLTGVRRLIYFSGSGVYGDKPGHPFDEDHGPMLPISTYGASKLASEALICAYCEMFGIEARVFRPANIVGPGQTHGVGFDFIRRLKTDSTRLRVLGDGHQTKSYIDINDTLDAVWLALPGQGFDVFNLASEDLIQVNEIALMAVAITNSAGCNLEHTAGDRGWNGDVPRIVFDCSKIRALGWKPKMTSAQAIYNAMQSMI